MKFLYRKKIIITFIFLLILGSYFVFVDLRIKNNYLKYFIWIHGETNNKKSEGYQNKFRYIFESIVGGKKSKVNLIITQPLFVTIKEIFTLMKFKKKFLKYITLKILLTLMNLKTTIVMMGAILINLVFLRFLQILVI